MPPPLLLDPASLDFDNCVAGPEAIGRMNPQRHEFQLLDRVVYQDIEAGLFAGYHDVKPGAWWARAHIPGRPIFPGVLMIEVAAQLSSYICHAVLGREDDFLGFAGVDEVKFRGMVTPPARFVVIGKARSVKPRRTVSEIQGFVDGAFVFEGVVTGMFF